jgi:integrase
VIGGQTIVGLGIIVSVSTLEFKPELEPERDNSMSRNQKDRIFKKNITRPIPKGAELFERSGQRFAKWTDKLGQKFEAPLNDTNRIQVQSETFYCSYLGASGKVITVSLETSDEKLAYRRFLELTKQSAGIRSGELSPSDLQKSENKKIPIADLVHEFEEWVRGKGTSDQHNREVISRLKTLIGMLNWEAFGDICRRDAVKLIGSLRGKKSERWRDYSCTTLGQFGRFLVNEVELLTENPFRQMHSNKTEDRRYVRRALTESEIASLLKVAQERSPERADIYRALLLTGLRLNELRTLRVADLHLELVTTPFIRLRGANEKNRKGSTIPLEPVAFELFRRLAKGKSARDLVVKVPDGLCRRLKGDLKKAGIEQCREELDRGVIRKNDVVDVHALRATYATLLVLGGTPLAIVQKRMRHSDPSLTANIYTMLGVSDLVQSDYRIGDKIMPKEESGSARDSNPDSFKKAT